jgi:hypothetical protein
MAHMRVCQTRYFVPGLRSHNLRDIASNQTKLRNLLEFYEHYTELFS